MATKTASIRLEKELYDKIDSKCSELGCTRNDFVKEAIESKLNTNEDKFKPYHDKYGNYYTYDKDRKIWVCHVNMGNARVV